jgi:hypothetical protein
MTLVAHIHWTDETKANLKAYAHRVHEDYRECLKCGCPYVTSGRYQEALCVECSMTFKGRISFEKENCYRYDRN